MVSWELNGLNASIQLPETYSASEEGWLFTDREAGSVILADYRVDFSVPVYSMNDVAENVETVAAWSAEWMQYSDYEILDAGGLHHWRPGRLPDLHRKPGAGALRPKICSSQR